MAIGEGEVALVEEGDRASRIRRRGLEGRLEPGAVAQVEPGVLGGRGLDPRHGEGVHPAQGRPGEIHEPGGAGRVDQGRREAEGPGAAADALSEEPQGRGVIAGVHLELGEEEECLGRGGGQGEGLAQVGLGLGLGHGIGLGRQQHAAVVQIPEHHPGHGAARFGLGRGLGQAVALREPPGIPVAGDGVQELPEGLRPRRQEAVGGVRPRGQSQRPVKLPQGLVRRPEGLLAVAPGRLPPGRQVRRIGGAPAQSEPVALPPRRQVQQPHPRRESGQRSRTRQLDRAAARLQVPLHPVPQGPLLGGIQPSSRHGLEAQDHLHRGQGPRAPPGPARSHQERRQEGRPEPEGPGEAG